MRPIFDTGEARLEFKRNANGDPVVGLGPAKTTDRFREARIQAAIDGDWTFSIEASIDGVNFVEIAAALTGTASTSTSGNAETYALTNNNDLTIEIDGGAVQTFTFLTGDFVAIGAATALEVAAVLNATMTGATADGTSGSVVITSDTRGTNSLVDVTGGTDAAILNFPAAVAGAGDSAITEVNKFWRFMRVNATAVGAAGDFSAHIGGFTVGDHE